jgi:hypothetical protein
MALKPLSPREKLELERTSVLLRAHEAMQRSKLVPIWFPLGIAILVVFAILFG